MIKKRPVISSVLHSAGRHAPPFSAGAPAANCSIAPPLAGPQAGAAGRDPEAELQLQLARKLGLKKGKTKMGGEDGLDEFLEGGWRRGGVCMCGGELEWT